MFIVLGIRDINLIRYSYRADIILMLNRGLRRLTVSGVCGTFQLHTDNPQG